MAKFHARIMNKDERKYTFNQSQQIFMQTGFIGYLRADFGSTGKEFWTTWNDFRKDLKTDEFKAEFDEVITKYRFDDEFLSSRNTMSKFCYKHPESSYQDERNHYGVRVDTEKYTYLMRLNPNAGEYNLYCYCYKRESFNNHLFNAKKGIRFIDSSYNEKFSIPDGESIEINMNHDDVIHRDCRYVDDYHVEIGSTIYHICEFAELCEKNNYTVHPEHFA